VSQTQDFQYQDIVFLSHFKGLPDSRQAIKVLYPLSEVLLLALIGVLCGTDSWVEIAKFGEKRLDFLRRFAPFENGTPSHDQLGDIFAMLDAEAFQRCFVNWVSSLTGLTGDVVAIDGKTLRRSYRQAGRKGAIHMISAFSAGQRVVLGQRKVADKSNEITAIPQLLELLTLKGAIVTIDAMGCQRDIARKIRDKEADYVLALKGNQGTMREDVELFFEEQKARNFKDVDVDRFETVEKSHGRIETRTCTAIDDVGWLRQRHDWAGLTSIVAIRSIREFDGKEERETRYFISSLPANAEKLANAIRSHWAVENSLHWVMDMVFRDDECRIRKQNAPANFAVVKHIAANLLRAAPGKDSMRVKRKMTNWDDEFLQSVITR
jgi:predicted transposase YbfD/YdcC